MKAAAITAKNLSKHFDASGASLEVLRGVELQVAAGEFVCLLGPSGSGKSTLLHCLAGLDEPSSGTVTVGGRTGQELLGASGYAMQKPLLLPWRTVRDNVMLGPVLAGRTRASAAHAADELLGQFGLAAFADQYPGVLSGGMAQKTALLRAVLYNYDYLLLDEPFASLDALTRLSMQLWLQDLWATFRSTVLCVTHDIREAILLSDRIYVLSHRPGTIIKEVAVDLPRPRTRDHLKSPRALELQEELEDLLLAQETTL